MIGELGQTRHQPNDLEPYLGFHQDGLLDIGIGLGLLLAALAITFDASWFFFIPIALIPLWPWLRKSIVAPRLKNLSLSEEQWTRIVRAKRIMIISLAISALFGALLIMTLPNHSSWAVMPLIIAVVLVGLLALTGYAYGLKRLYVYTGLATLAMVAVAAFKFSLTWSLAILGTVMLIVGITFFAKFLRDYPLSK